MPDEVIDALVPQEFPPNIESLSDKLRKVAIDQKTAILVAIYFMYKMLKKSKFTADELWRWMNTHLFWIKINSKEFENLLIILKRKGYINTVNNEIKPNQKLILLLAEQSPSVVWEIIEQTENHLSIAELLDDEDLAKIIKQLPRTVLENIIYLLLIDDKSKIREALTRIYPEIYLLFENEFLE